MLKKKKIWISFFLLALIFSAWHFKGNVYRWWYGGELNLSTCNYAQCCQKIIQEKKKLSTQISQNEKKTLRQASSLLTNTLYSKMFQCWYGTNWSYSGISETPQNGSIACGYFVTTLLRDAGVPIQRVKLAQCSSAEMIRALVKPTYIYNYNRATMSDFRSAILKKGEGMYIIGLDNHTGFIACMRNEVYFVHSSGAFPFCVIKEKVMDSAILKKSSWKLCGAFTQDPTFLKRWMKG